MGNVVRVWRVGEAWHGTVIVPRKLPDDLWTRIVCALFTVEVEQTERHVRSAYGGAWFFSDTKERVPLEVETELEAHVFDVRINERELLPPA